MKNERETEIVPAAKEEWVKPEIGSVLPITESRGNGGVGFDFASEVS